MSLITTSNPGMAGTSSRGQGGHLLEVSTRTESLSINKGPAVPGSYSCETCHQ